MAASPPPDALAHPQERRNRANSARRGAGRVARATVIVALTVVATAAAAARPLAAQRIASTLPPTAPVLGVGARARIHVVGQSSPVRGIVILAQPDTLVLQTGEWREGGLPPSQLGIPTRLVTGAEVQVGTTPRVGTAMRYGAIGAAAAAVLGALAEVGLRRATGVKDASESPYGSYRLQPRLVRTAVVAGAVGGFVGGVVGSLTPRPIWRPATLPTLPDGPR